MLVYKYVSQQRLDVLTSGLIRFTQPADLNDPFEAFPDLTAFSDTVAQDLLKNPKANFGKNTEYATPQLIRFITYSNLKQIVTVLGEKFVVLSLSKCSTNLLMWAHYTDCHRGYTIGFDSDADVFKPGNGKASGGLRQIEYSDQRASLPMNFDSSASSKDAKTSTDAFFYTKSMDWSYEQEMRILAHPKFADMVVPRDEENSLFMFRFAPAAVKELIIGSNISTANIVKLINIWRSTYAGAKIGFASLNPHQFKVDVSFVPDNRASKLYEFTASDTLSWLLHSCFG